ncbi:MAG: hypothetical protein FWG66_12450 [Spirochaetes bacterium]|nr:hypothetical protein [Spirochaetota bacterium]
MRPDVIALPLQKRKITLAHFSIFSKPQSANLQKNAPVNSKSNVFAALPLSYRVLPQAGVEPATGHLKDVIALPLRERKITLAHFSIFSKPPIGQFTKNAPVNIKSNVFHALPLSYRELPQAGVEPATLPL